MSCKVHGNQESLGPIFLGLQQSSLPCKLGRNCAAGFAYSFEYVSHNIPWQHSTLSYFSHPGSLYLRQSGVEIPMKFTPAFSNHLTSSHDLCHLISDSTADRQEQVKEGEEAGIERKKDHRARCWTWEQAETETLGKASPNRSTLGHLFAGNAWHTFCIWNHQCDNGCFAGNCDLIIKRRLNYAPLIWFGEVRKYKTYF